MSRHRGERVGAVDAAAGLFARSGFIEQAIDLVEVADSFGRVAFRRGIAWDFAPVVFRGPRYVFASHRGLIFTRAAGMPAQELAKAVHLLAGDENGQNLFSVRMRNGGRHRT